MEKQPGRTTIEICPDPVFIIGAPRSGTTALAKSLAQHSHFWAPNESEIFEDLFKPGSSVDDAYNRGVRYLRPGFITAEAVSKAEFVACIGSGVNALFTQRSRGRRWIDHTVRNTLYAHELGEAFPGARFLNIVRDGRRCVHSTLHYRNRLGKVDANRLLPEGWLAPWARDFREACRIWARFVTAATTFATKNPARCLTLNHEDLITSSHDAFERIYAFLDVPAYEVPPAFIKSARINTSFPEKREFETDATREKSWLHWTLGQKFIFIDEALPAMVECGVFTQAEADRLVTDTRRAASFTSLPSATGSRREPLQPIFISGQYKCGTTWLQNILTAHPQVLGINEFDMVKATYDIDASGARLKPVSDRLHHFFDGAGWCTYRKDGEWHNTDIVARMEKGEPLVTSERNPQMRQKFQHLRADTAHRLYRAVRDATAANEAMDAFVEAVCEGWDDMTHVVFKGADQISVFGQLMAWRPNARKIVITRDGRDAAISTIHFHELLRDVAPPWHEAKSDLDYWHWLKTWAHRADLIIDQARAGDLVVIRYEDLTRDFRGTLKPLLAWLGLDHSDDLVELINSETCFERMSGRKRGVAAKDSMRKGVSGEWIGHLTDDEKLKAWEVAGAQLSNLGYTQNGQLLPNPYSLRSTSLRELQTMVERHVPAGSTMIVVSGGKDIVGERDSRTVWHFPQDEQGNFADEQSISSDDVIRQLEQLRSRGAAYLLFPDHTFWWLWIDSFAAFRNYLEANYREAAYEAGVGLLYALTDTVSTKTGVAGAQHSGAIEQDIPVIAANPNPAAATIGCGRTTIVWHTGTTSPGEVYVRISESGQNEQLFASGVGGSKEAPWIQRGITYEFRLYEGSEHSNLLSSVQVIAGIPNFRGDSILLKTSVGGTGNHN